MTGERLLAAARVWRRLAFAPFPDLLRPVFGVSLFRFASTCVRCLTIGRLAIAVKGPGLYSARYALRGLPMCVIFPLCRSRVLRRLVPVDWI